MGVPQALCAMCALMQVSLLQGRRVLPVLPLTFGVHEGYMHGDRWSCPRSGVTFDPHAMLPGA